MNAARIAALRAAVERSEAADWPTCCHCTEASRFREGGERWVPVEGYRVEPDVFADVPLVGGARVIDSVNRRGGLRTVAAPGLQQSVTAIGKLHAPRMLGSKGWFSVIAECHGREAEAQIDVPLRWGVANVRSAIRGLLFWGLDAKATSREK